MPTPGMPATRTFEFVWAPPSRLNGQVTGLPSASSLPTARSMLRTGPATSGRNSVGITGLSRLRVASQSFPQVSNVRMSRS